MRPLDRSEPTGQGSGTAGEDPVVSVLVLAYNHGPYLAEALDSILLQETDFAFEVLIGEDRSTDDTLSIARRYEERDPSKVRVLTDERNVGMQENLRRLVLASRGSYLAFCEGDDYWNSRSKLARQVAVLEEQPDTGAVHSDFVHIARVAGEWRALPGYWRHHGVAIPVGEVFPDLVQRNFIQTCTLVVRAGLARLYLASGLPVDTYKVGDWPLCLFISMQSKVAYVDDSLATYRRVEGSATNQGHQADIARARNHMAMATDFCRLTGASPELEKAAHEAAMRTILDSAVRAADLDQARSALDWIEMNIPSEGSSLRSKLGRAAIRNVVGIRLVRRYAAVGGGSELHNYVSRPPAAGEHR